MASVLASPPTDPLPPMPPAPEPLAAAADDSPPVRRREWVAVLLSIAVADVTVYRSAGYSGWAAFFAAMPFVLAIGAPTTGRRGAAGLLAAMLAAVAVRTVWLGGGLLVPVGLTLIVLFAMTLAGRVPDLIDAAAYALQPVAAGGVGLIRYGRSAGRPPGAPSRSASLAFVLPAAALLAFGTIFVLANPDLATAVGRRLGRFFESFFENLGRYAPGPEEILFWGVVAWVVVGLLRPILRTSILAPLAAAERAADASDAPLFESSLYPAVRNTLVAVIGLFAVYLAFEFKTLWFRTFPKGFYYAGYAHQGAAWLTVALALATVVLSAIFRGGLLADPRLARLRRLAWVWSALNLVLAAAVYNRMWIYVDFNGMTRMRTVGLFGISAVVVGFLLVVRKIAKGHDFVWLIRRDLWTLGAAVFLYAVTPVDTLVHTYNVRQILAGRPAPVVQITEHPVDSGGVLMLPPLVNAPDPAIREGIRAMLAARAVALEERLAGDRSWSSFQLADRLALDRLNECREDWERFGDPRKQAAALQRFRDYAYQWY